MENNLKPGVTLNVLPTKKFKNVTIMIDFIAPTDVKNFTKRAMTAAMLQSTSAHYATPEKLSRKLSEMYGAMYGVNVVRYGKRHILRVKFNFVNGRYLPHKKDLFQEAIDFLKEVIFKPNIGKAGFQKEIFKIQKSNLLNYLLSLKNNKNLYSALQLKKLFFKNPSYATPLLGNSASFEALGPKDTYQYYKNLLQKDEIKIYVMGDISFKETQNLIKQLPFDSRASLKEEVSYEPDVTAQIEKKEVFENVSQGNLNLGYRVPAKFNDTSYYAALVLNELWGGGQQSLLFSNIREKNSLAYYIYSVYDPFLNFIMIQTGIDSKNKTTVIKLISKQLSKIKQKDFSDELLKNAKAALIDSNRSNLDNQRQLMNYYGINNLMHYDLNINNWEQKIKNVTKNEVANLAHQINLQAMFFLRRDENQHV